MGYADSDRAADWLHLLIEGNLVIGATQDSRHPARDLVALVLG